MRTHRIALDRDLRTGFGACAGVDPLTFALDPGGLVAAQPGSAGRHAASAATAACATGPILVPDDAGIPA